LLAGRAAAQTQEPASVQTSETSVTVCVAGAERNVAALESALADPFGRLGIALRFEHPARIDPATVLTLPSAPSSAKATLWFDLASSAHVPIYITDGRHERIYTRDFELTRGLDDVAIEQLVYVARSSVESILAGVDIGVRRDEYEASLVPSEKKEPDVTPEATPRKTIAVTPMTALRAGLSYEAQWMGNRAWSHGPGVNVGLGRGPISLDLRTFYRFPFEVRGAELGARITRGGTGIDASFDIELGSAFLWTAGLGSALELSRVSPLNDGAANATLSSAFWVIDGVVRGVSTIGYRWHKRWSISIAGGADVDLALVRYVVSRVDASETVFVPYRVRPFVGAFFTLSL
jgi:hypothetical protein